MSQRNSNSNKRNLKMNSRTHQDRSVHVWWYKSRLWMMSTLMMCRLYIPLDRPEYTTTWQTATRYNVCGSWAIVETIGASHPDWQDRIIQQHIPPVVNFCFIAYPSSGNAPTYYKMMDGTNRRNSCNSTHAGIYVIMHYFIAHFKECIFFIRVNLFL